VTPDGAAAAKRLAADMEQAVADAIHTGSLEDLRRSQAAMALLERVDGKPKETIETAPEQASIAAIRELPLERKMELLRRLEGRCEVDEVLRELGLDPDEEL